MKESAYAKRLKRELSANPPKPRNPQDLTTRNARAYRKDLRLVGKALKSLDARVQALTARIDTLERGRFTQVGGTTRG